MTPLKVVPNINPKPNKKKMIEPMEKSIRFFIMMFTAFLARVSPASTMAKPACIKKTKNAAMHVHNMFASFLNEVISASASNAASASWALTAPVNITVAITRTARILNQRFVPSD